MIQEGLPPCVSVSQGASPALVPAAGRRRVRFFSLLSRREM